MDKNSGKNEISEISERELIDEWRKTKIFESEPDGRKKYFITVPYPYTSGPLHVGHARSYTLGDITARYYRMMGFNVLFPMAFHISGTPILAVSKKIENGDRETIKMHEEYVSFYGDGPEKVNEFKNPEILANYYANAIREDFEMMGYSIDWSRSFNTGEAFYNKFVEWQYLKLNEKNLIKKGKHAVYFCPRCNNPVTTDDIKSGDELDIEMQEYYLIKEKFHDGFLVAATLRPETLYGVTNVWVSEKDDYVKAKVGDEIWYVSEKCLEKLKKQLFNAELIEKFKGSYFIGKEVEIPLLNRKVEIYGAEFVDVDVATGIVNSVPMHAPYDYVALRDIGKLSGERIIDSKISITDVVKGIKNQKDKVKLEKATQILYKDEYYNGKTNEKCMEFGNLRVPEAKEKILGKLKSLGLLDKIYENNIKSNGEIIKAKCRCGTEIEIRVIEDQWFLDYKNEEWKNTTRALLSEIKIVPEIYRTSFENTIEWLHEWPCTRNRGLGTRLPFDKKWMIESLSDSTIYMAFYTISKKLREMNLDEMDEKFFDYVFLGKEFDGCEKYSEIRKEFLYYYPMDERRTGIAHIQNHLTFMLFHHTAIFDKSLWPKKISLNEMLISEGKKMSKSLGNVVPLKKAVEKYGADVVRLYLAYSADPDTTLDWREALVSGMKNKIAEFSRLVSLPLQLSVHELDKPHPSMLEPVSNNIANIAQSDNIAQNSFIATENTSAIKNISTNISTETSSMKKRDIDKWILSRLNHAIRECNINIERSQMRLAIQKGFFEFMNDLKWYLKREKPNFEVMRIISEKWIKMMSVFIPFTCEKLWKKYGEGSILKQSYPQYEESLSDPKIEAQEEMIKNLLENARNFISLISKHKKTRKIYIYIADEWKNKLFREIKQGKKIEELMKNEEYRKHGSEVVNIAKKIHRDEITQILTPEEEYNALNSAKQFFETELNMEVEIQKEITYDPENKAKFALPLKPAIYVE